MSEPQNISEVVTVLPEPMTCQSRMRQWGPWGPWERAEGLDRWQRHRNGDRVCSFCGSLHLEDFTALVEQALQDGSDVQIEPSDKAYKVYVNRPSVKSAMEGGIKFYTWHGPSSVTPADAEAYRQAIEKSAGRFKERMRTRWTGNS